MAEETENDNNLVPANDRIISVSIEDQMKTAYIDYSMTVIVSRALPDARDGMKPVHRRVLYGMLDLGVTSSKPYKKSARIVGDVLGKYHPHGDTSVYDAMVRLAQDWNMRYPLVDGQGNYGSVDGDPPAAMRYTEARLKKIAEEILSDINKDTVDYQLNFDDSLQEPTVLPTRIPNLLVNGASGIAVGMATNMAPHNLTEVINGTVAYINNRDIDIPELMQYIKGPDFPTGGLIYGYSGVQDAENTGRGRVVMRAKTEIEVSKSGKESIVVTEIPYQINKANMIERTAELVNEKKLEGISAIRDESDRTGLRIVYDIKRDANANVVLNNLFKYTALQTSFSVNNIALVKGRPVLMNLKDMIQVFVDHRHDVITRRTRFELSEAEKRAHILEGYLIALDHLDEVIKLIRASATPEDARVGLMEKFGLSDLQARAILDMTLRRLTGLEHDKIKEEYAELMKTIEYLKSVLADEGLRMQIIKDELIEIREKYGDERRSVIVHSAEDMRMEDFIDDEEIVITISHNSYVKRTPLTEYKRQGRGGRGSIGSTTREEDFTEHIITASAHNYMLLFTESGRCFWLRAFEVPEGSRTSKGRALQNIINIPKDEKIKAYILVKNLKDQEYLENNFIIMCTKKGTIKKTSLEAYSRPRANGINAININEGDQLLEACLTSGTSEIVMALRSGRAIRFNESTVRPMGRTATGVRGITLGSETDEVIGMISVDDPETTVLVVSEKGYGKRTDIEDYRVTNRGGKGVKTISVTEKTGSLVAVKGVNDTEDLMIINKSGIVIRISVEQLRVMGRATQGVRLINLKGDDEIASITKVDREEEEEEVIADEDGEMPTTKDGEASTEITETDQDEKSESNEE
ncbi:MULTISPECIES: DNA gyrase subunit A [Sphingobacterium]|jgi:DNA gyrase subunit A|uniref:DNA gyrase subunit A n=1 Tax=Sphingobacterium TaxID=28453 RepID=UPI0004E5FF4B|nr:MULTISPECIES: DNA gyrase subunit A [Sphingobacterium]CDT00640.1 DNA gyrase subunit A [Sphingobacterium sp. PM2-P1-29]SJN25912.1 DNA gyrase subunit A [Sphingobacterium faecium PCAi_F2.5]UPZ36008.1 DNA gyrase subunit A [Sphingobacterium sp. PCS056]UXD71545.1 DNA gyrase subunit A [Sphingobacterium faecium]WGQ15198.1 DNA gyrase subunit A [Sphingobacterium faecium]